jgi:hypothetical protein
MLAGLGEHSHLLNKAINLDTHVTDIVNLITWEDLNGICLGAHSFAGWSGSGALEQIGDRVSSIVWVDAFTPADGEKAIDVVNEVVRKTALSAADKGEAGLPAAPAALFPVNEKDRAYVDSKLTPQPVGTYLQPIKLSGAGDRVAKKTISEPRGIGCRRSIRRLSSARPIHRGARSKTPAPATLS